MQIVISSVDFMGTLGQCLGIADRLDRRNAERGEPTTTARISWRQRIGALARRVLPRFGPDVILSCGRSGERHARRVRNLNSDIVWAHVEIPEEGRSCPDLVFVSWHDWLPEFAARPGFHRIHGVPHRFSPTALAERRSGARLRVGAQGRAVVTCLIGGENPAFGFSAASVSRVADSLHSLADGGRLVLVSTSRRTPPDLGQRLREIAGESIRVFDGLGPNPYPDFLAAADAVLVTEDSISMCCEAVATGRPVFLLGLEPREGERLRKFRRFQQHMIEDLGAVRFFDGSIAGQGAHFDDAAFVAERILECRGALSG